MRGLMPVFKGPIVVTPLSILILFFFQAEDGIRDDLVTGVQTCALPIFREPSRSGPARSPQSVPMRHRGVRKGSSLDVPDSKVSPRPPRSCEVVRPHGGTYRGSSPLS